MTAAALSGRQWADLAYSLWHLVRAVQPAGALDPEGWAAKRDQIRERLEKALAVQNAVERGLSPVRTLSSQGLDDQTDPTWQGCDPGEHHMISIRVNSELIKYVEECAKCAWIDGASLSWWAEDAIKRFLPQNVQRIAVAVSTDPFAFVQSEGQELGMFEVLTQALAAAAHSGPNAPPERYGSILQALYAEIDRFQRLAVEQAKQAWKDGAAVG